MDSTFNNRELSKMDVSHSSSSSLNSLDQQYPVEGYLNCRDTDDEDDNSQTSSGTKSTPPSPNHKRYLFPKKEFVEILRPEEINWFYKQDGEKKWTPFIGYDSLRIECRYRALAFGPQAVEEDIDVKERILVRGGLYEVDVNAKQCIPVYWSDDISNIMRGTWFHDNGWQPLEEGYAIQVETEHLAQFMGHRIADAPPPAVKGPKPVIHNIKFNEFHIDWNSPNEVFLFSESTSSKFMRKVSNSLGWQKSGSRLRRGYCYEAVMDDKPPDITHLVFVIHGIGQKMETGSIVKCCKDLRTKVNHLKYKLFPGFDNTNQRAEFLPVEWRSSLKLDGDTVDNITPNKMKGVRNILNSSAMDILYYTSPLYRIEITHSLKSELNRLYNMFCLRHPYFEANNGKISIVAHSLGSVISYDIITGWNPLKMYDQFVTSVINDEREQACGSSELLAELDNARKRVNELEVLLTSVHERQKTSPKLKFTIENLICLGSPLAVFLALRGIRPQGTGTLDHIIPSSICKRLFNIYHPSDPVAYRLEPLVLKHYATIIPLPIHHYDQSKKPPYVKMVRKAYAALKSSSDEQVNGKMTKIEEVADKEDSDSASEKASNSQPKKFSFSKWLGRKSKDEEALSAELKMLQKYDNEAKKLDVSAYLDPKDIDKTEIEYRIDYQLRERSLENSYMSLLTSHTSYWSNKDVALFILTHLHPHLQDEQPH